MANKLSVAFIGTGIMGAPIASHILDAGYPVTVNNRTKSKAAALIERGAVWADTPLAFWHTPLPSKLYCTPLMVAVVPAIILPSLAGFR
jgi:pyrroline-5-carboxylate reductase